MLSICLPTFLQDVDDYIKTNFAKKKSTYICGNIPIDISDFLYYMMERKINIMIPIDGEDGVIKIYPEYNKNSLRFFYDIYGGYDTETAAEIKVDLRRLRKLIAIGDYNKFRNIMIKSMEYNSSLGFEDFMAEYIQNEIIFKTLEISDNYNFLPFNSIITTSKVPTDIIRKKNRVYVYDDKYIKGPKHIYVSVVSYPIEYWDIKILPHYHIIELLMTSKLSINLEDEIYEKYEVDINDNRRAIAENMKRILKDKILKIDTIFFA